MEETALLRFIAGLVFLIAGAEVLVRSASRLASAAGLSRLVIGLTVVAFGTSAPELAVSVKAALVQGGADIAVGNVVGSNLFNVLIILGASAVLVPLRVSQQLIRIDVPVMIVLSLLVLLLGGDGELGRGNGILLVAGLVAYTFFTLQQGRKAAHNDHPDRERPTGWRIAADSGLILVGLALLVAGSEWMIDGAVRIARTIGISELVIGLTLVAAGTSLPELATSILATLRGERDLAVGNVVGSNIFNILGVLGISAVVAPHGITVAPAAVRFDIPVMIAVALACLPFFFTGYRVSRGEGLLFLGYYLAYAFYLFLSATGHDALPVWSGVMLLFVVPLTGIIMVITVVRQIREGIKRG